VKILKKFHFMRVRFKISLYTGYFRAIALSHAKALKRSRSTAHLLLVKYLTSYLAAEVS
jgi:hypothetical protein